MSTESAAANAEAIEAWSGPLFERFVTYRDIVADGLGAHGDAAIAAHPPRPGDRVLDIGCGFGDSTRRLAELVGDAGEAVGLDVSAPFLEIAGREAEEAGAANVSFVVADAQVADLGGPYDYVFSRMGIMYFANPVAALHNVREAMAPGGRLSAAVWRRKLDNQWARRAELVADRYLEHPDQTEEPTCGPGPFSMADADVVTEQLLAAGFTDVGLVRSDLPMWMGADLDRAVAFALTVGPAGELLRLWGERADAIRPRIEIEVRAALADLETPDGVLAPASTWLLSATAPAG
jgi:SAM-dependent methyltransferase